MRLGGDGSLATLTLFPIESASTTVSSSSRDRLALGVLEDGAVGAGDSTGTGGGAVLDGRRLAVGAAACLAFAVVLPLGDLGAGGDDDEGGNAGVGVLVFSGVDDEGALAGPGVCAEVGTGDGVDVVVWGAFERAGVGPLFFGGGGWSDI